MSDAPCTNHPPSPHEGVDGDAFTALDGRTLYLRPIRADDVAALQRGFARLTPEQIRMRVFHSMTELTPEVAARMVIFDPATRAAYVATDADGEIRGEARIYVDMAAASAEFALIVDPELTNQGVGRALMRRLIDESRRRGLAVLWGLVLTENGAMLDFASRLGATREPVADEPGLLRVRFDLRDPRVSSET